ncbi:MAG: leucine-rich repeat domain-containing protein, partial [Clostridiales bacterium]|nr:leucine-rich repeat domain-containing protein [Clostridiales bacterium]
MKRMLTILVVSAMLMSFIPAFGLDSDAETYGDWLYTVSDGSATIVRYLGIVSGELDIPSQIGGYRVTSIGDYAFEWCGGLTSVVIPDSVTSIGDFAFSRCEGLTSVVIPGSVTSIGACAFSGCSELVSITVAKNNGIYHSKGNCLIETASKTLIAVCKNSVIPNDGSVTSIGDYVFAYCTGLTSVVIPDSVTSIGAGAFFGCDSLTSVVLPGSV